MAIWALGYDYNYSDYWDVIFDNFTDCGVKPCSDTLYDFGGPTRNYYDDENYTYTITSDNAASITLNFDTIDIESNYDYLYVYDGPGITSAQIPGSPFSGQFSGFSWTSSGPDVTFRFTSDGATTASGWKLDYSCTQDMDPPVTQIDHNNIWETQDFNVDFTDTDVGTGVASSYYLVSDYDGSEWGANGTSGFYFDDFNVLNPSWTNQTGLWQLNSSALDQTDELQSNSNIWTSVDQNSNSSYLYEWDAEMTGTGTNKRSGIHFFCDDPTLPNRGNSYFVYFRADSDKTQIYKVVNDVWTLEADIPTTIDEAVWHNYRILFDPATGLIQAFVDGVISAEWTDSSPHVSGNSVSFRTAGCKTSYDNFRVFKSRSLSEIVSVGLTGDVRYQNQDPFTPSCEIYSICLDSVNLWSQTESKQINIDWTPAGPLLPSDGFSVELDTFYNATEITANWLAYSDTQSTTIEYFYAVGDTPGDSNIVAWTSNGLNTIFTESGLSLTPDSTFYTSIRSVNGAGIVSPNYISDGQLLLGSIGIGENEEVSFSLFPNPVINNLTIEIARPLTEELIVEIISSNGQLVWNGNLAAGESQLNIDLNNMASGYYSVRFVSKNSSESVVIVKR